MTDSQALQEYLNELKRCSNCFQAKLKDEFYKKKNGLQSRCKACNAEVVRGYALRSKERKLKQKWDQVYGRAL